MNKQQPFTRGSHSFTFHLFPETGLLNLWNVGWEVQTDTSYYWDGNKRAKDNDSIIFQYTIAGSGVLEIGKERYTVGQHQAFIVSVPSDHRYYYPENAKEPWEFIYISLQGASVQDIWQRLIQKSGPIVSLPPNSPLIRSLYSIYADTKADGLRDPYLAATQGYQFLIECFRAMAEERPQNEPYHYQRALAYIEAHYHEQICLDNIAEEVGVSRYTLTRLFKKQLHTTPISYVTDLRMRKACSLLLHTNRTIKQIAADVGYPDDNYFHKVFRRYTGSSATQFRSNGDLSQLYARKIVK